MQRRVFGSGSFLCLAFFCLARLGSGQATDFEGRNISDIQYDPPAPLTERDLNHAQPLKKGTPLHLSEVSGAIERLYATGRFEDIRVDAEPSGANDVTLRFLTQLAMFTGHVGVVGKISNPPNRGQIENAAQFNLGTPFSQQDLQAAQDNIRKLLDANGLYEATLEARTASNPKTQSVSITFYVTSGKRAKYTHPVIQGDPKLSDSAVLRATGWRIPLIHWWRQVTQARTRGGIDGLKKKYQSQDRLTAQVDLDKLDYDSKTRRVKPSLTIDAGPKVKITAVEAKVSKSKLKAYVPVYDEGAVDRDLLVEGARNLRNYFQSQGYYDATVDFTELPLKNDILTIQYTIGRGPRYKLVNITIQGNKYFKTDTLRDRMFLQTTSFRMRHGRYSEAFRRRDEESIENLYKNNGFQDVKVTSTLQNPYKGKQGNIGITFTVDEGAQWFVDDLQLDGIVSLDRTTLMANLASNPGQPFSLVNIAADRNTILAQYYTNGFPAASFEYAVNPSGMPNHVRLVYRVKEGDPQFVRGVVITGVTRTRPSLVNSRIGLAPGDKLSPTQISAAQRRLYNLGVFAEVDTGVQNQQGDTQDKYVLFDFEEANRYTMALGFGAEIAQFGSTTTSLSSPGAATGFSPRGSFDLSRLNFLGLGQTISLHSRVSNLEQLANLEYLIPHPFGSSDTRQLSVNFLYDKTRDVRTFSSTREEGSVQVSQQFSRALRGLFRFAYRRVTTSNVVIPALLVPQLLQPVRIGMLSANLVEDRRDDPTDAHRGVYNTIDIGLASRIFGSQRDFVRGLARNATYTPIGKNLVFARQTIFGVILPYNPPTGLSAAASVPLPERFFGGGENTNRGLPFNQAGPRDIGTPAGPGGTATEPTGFPLGGNAEFFNTFELRFPLIGQNIGGAIFHDAGNVFSTLSDVSFRITQRNRQDFNYMVHAVGFGIRYKSPVGAVRVDLAYSINPPKFVGFSGTINELLQCNPNLPASELPSACQGVPQQLSHFQFSFAIGQSF